MHCSNLGALLLACAAMGVAAPAWAQAGARPDTGKLRCESRDGRLRECPADVRGGVRLAKQLSRSQCLRGRTWGASRDGVWVSQGCRAEFVYGLGSDVDAKTVGRRDRTLKCESKDGRWKHCLVQAEGQVELSRQLSRSSCLRNQTWGVDQRGVWVSGGCRAEFRITSPEVERGGGSIQLVRCESKDGSQEHCPVNTRGGVRVSRQISRAACIEGHSWRFDRSGIWVKEGCRADFEVGFRDEPGWGLGRND